MARKKELVFSKGGWYPNAHYESGVKFEEKLIFYFKNDKNLVNFDRSTKKSKNFHFDWSFLCKVYNVWPKKVQWSIFHDTEESCKIWRKTDLWFGKWHQEFSKFLSEHLKMSKLVFLWDPLVQRRKWPQNSKVSKMYTFMGSFWPNYIMFELKKSRGVIFNCTQD